MAKTRKCAPWGEVVGEEVTYSGAGTWARETTITAGAHSLASYKADHTGSSGLRFRMFPLIGDGTSGDASSAFGATTYDHSALYFSLYQTDITPASAMLITEGLGVFGTSSETPAFLEIQTDGTVRVIATDTTTVLSTFTPPWTANAFWAVRLAIDIDASDDVRLRIWIVAASATSWGSPVLDATYVTAATTTITNIAFLTSYNFKGGTIPGTIHYFDDMWQYVHNTTDDSDLLPGPFKYAVDVPTGNSATNVGFDEGTGTFDFAEVDEALTGAANDADFSRGDTGAGGLKVETYTYTATTKLLSTSTIHCMNTVGRLSVNGVGGVPAGQVCVRDGGVNSFGTGIAVTGAGVWVDGHWTHLTAPTSGAWTIALADALEIGARKATVTAAHTIDLSRSYKGFGFTKSGSLLKQYRSSQRANLVR